MQPLFKFAYRIGVAITFALPTLGVQAEPVVGPSDMSFYSPPMNDGGNHGDLIWYRAATVELGDEAPAFIAWNLLYHSTDAVGQPNYVTGTMLVPSEGWAGQGSRPVVSYAVGTHGLAQSCAPSIQMSQGKDYENINISAALNAGYAVLISDNPGYTNNAGLPGYMVGKAQAHAVLDIVTAASQVPGSIVTADSKTAIWGYSQGGQTAAWAGEVQRDYAPDLNLVGIASGGTPADFLDTAYYLDGSTGASFLFSAILGLSQQYPEEFPVADYLNSTGEAAYATTSNECVFEALFNLMNDELAQYTIGNKDLTTLLDELPEAKELVLDQALGSNKIDVPVYLYHGQADEFIPLDQSYELKKKYCRKGTNVRYELYPSEHIVTQFQAAPSVTTWLNNRFEGKRAIGTCVTLKGDPVANANPGGGNFVVSLNEWPLDAELKLKTLNQTVELPTESTFTADTDMTAQTLEGSLEVPNFSTKLNIVLPLDVRLSVVASSPTLGSATLDSDGILRVNGSSYADVKVRSAGISFIQIPFGCQTRESVEFPLDFEGPVSALGSGALTFAGTTTFPPMRSCGLFNGLFTTLMSGAGQTYSFNVSPPTPELN